MNKTVTINISGIIFHIEEDAYESLSRYMQTIKGYFSSTDGGNEIMSDIEARIAELLQGRINAAKQVILMADVMHVMDVMGKPEEFGADDKGTDAKAEHDEPAAGQGEKIRRRLFRNPDDKVIGGVCGGLAEYFDIDAVWVRLAMFLLVFFGGLSLWVYIVMWIIIPLARTTAEKFAMRGESANVNTIYRSFREEAEDVKNRFTKYGRDFKNSDYNRSLRNNVSGAVAVIFNILGRLLGLFIFLIGSLLLFGYLASIFGISVFSTNTNLSAWKAAFFDAPSDYALAVLAYVIVVGIPILMLIYGGIKLLFRIHYSNRWLNLSLGIVWLIGLVLGFYVAVVTARQFSESSRIKETVELHGVGDTLIIKMRPAAMTLHQHDFDNKDDLDNYFSNDHSGYTIGETGKMHSIMGFAELNVTEGQTDSIEMVITQSAYGSTKKEANENARAVRYSYHQNGRELVFDQIFTVDAGSRFRAQELDIRIKLPKGKVVYFDKSTKYLLDDIDNTTNTWDGDMVSRRWIMTEKGLKCIDCDNLEHVDGQYHDEEGDEGHRSNKVIINEHGIHVKEKDAEIRIDENGIKIKTPEKNVEVDKDKSGE